MEHCQDIVSGYTPKPVKITIKSIFESLVFKNNFLRELRRYIENEQKSKPIDNCLLKIYKKIKKFNIDRKNLEEMNDLKRCMDIEDVQPKINKNNKNDKKNIGNKINIQVPQKIFEVKIPRKQVKYEEDEKQIFNQEIEFQNDNNNNKQNDPKSLNQSINLEVHNSINNEHDNKPINFIANAPWLEEIEKQNFKLDSDSDDIKAYLPDELSENSIKVKDAVMEKIIGKFIITGKIETPEILSKPDKLKKYEHQIIEIQGSPNPSVNGYYRISDCKPYKLDQYGRTRNQRKRHLRKERQDKEKQLLNKP